MFYTYAEKQGNVFFDGWQMRQLAFDTMRRYLYYSASTLSSNQIAVPMDNDNPLPPRDGHGSLGDSFQSMPTSRTSPGAPISPSGYREYTATPPQPNLPSEVQWRKKVKVDYICLVAKDHEFLLEDPHLRETDLFQVEIHGESRVLQQGEYPAPGPMLVPAAGWGGLPDRFTVDNEEFIADPFFHRELYEALRDQFGGLRHERERLERTTGITRDPKLAKIQTLLSPRGKGEGLAKGTRMKIIFRLRTEYEFRRFWFVVQSVLGYDKLGVRPYRGLPPYDPRNGLIFAHIPMCVYHTFKALDKAVMYTFLRGDLVGRTLKGELTIFLHGAYLCITHDMVMVLRDSGNIPRWVPLKEVQRFEYNRKCPKPYFAFLTDPGAPDIVFIPQPPVYGPDAVRRFSPQVETMRVRHVMHESCLASIEARRVIDIAEATESAVRTFIERVERDDGRRLNFDPAVGYRGPLSCPLPKEQLAAVWREVQTIYAARDLVAISQAAIPLYNNNTNDSDLTPEQLQALDRRLERERETRFDIVGMPIDEARQVDPSQVPAAHRRHHHRHHTRTSSRDRARGVSSPRTPPPGADGALRRANSATVDVVSRMAGTAGGGGEGSGPLPASGAAPIALPADRLQTPQMDTAPHGTNPLDGLPVETERSDETVGNDSFASTDGSFGHSLVYGVPGARYLTHADVVGGGVLGVSPSTLGPDNHTVVMGQTPMAGGRTAPHRQGASLLDQEREVNVDELMSRSFAHMRTTLPAPSDPVPPEAVRAMRRRSGSAGSFTLAAAVPHSNTNGGSVSTAGSASGSRHAAREDSASAMADDGRRGSGDGKNTSIET